MKDTSPRERLVLPSGGTAEEILAGLSKVAPSGPDAILRFADAAASLVPERSATPQESFEAHLLFELSGQTYAAPVASVLEILRVADIVRIPGAPPHVRGVMNVRGRVLPVVELRTRIELEPLACTPASRVVVAEVLGRVLGILVDAVLDVARLSSSKMESPPIEASSNTTDYVRALYRREQTVLLVVDLERALHVPRGTAPGPENRGSL